MELGRNSVSKHHIQPEYGDEQADAGRDCRTRLARPNCQAGANADREIFIFPVQLTTYRIGNLTRLIHTLAIYVTIMIHNVGEKEAHPFTVYTYINRHAGTPNKTKAIVHN